MEDTTRNTAVFTEFEPVTNLGEFIPVGTDSLFKIEKMKYRKLWMIYQPRC